MANTLGLDIARVLTTKEVTNADGSFTRVIVEEDVAVTHKLLKQSESPNFVKGTPGKPECVVYSNMTAKTAVPASATTVNSSTPKEYTVPGYEIMTQADLKVHYENRWDVRARKLMNQHCGPKSVMWLDYLEGKTTQFAHSFWDFAHSFWDFIKAPRFREVILPWTILFFVAITILVRLVPVRDGKLEATYQAHHDIVQMLNSSRGMDVMSTEVAHKANRIETVGHHLAVTRLPEKDEMVRSVEKTAQSMHDISDRLLEFRLDVHTMASNLRGNKCTFSLN
ncbi:hypothetical protein PG987_008145 [Apiospora arundinis]